MGSTRIDMCTHFHHYPIRTTLCEEPERCTACLFFYREEIREGAEQEIMQFLPPYQEDSEVDSPDIL